MVLTLPQVVAFLLILARMAGFFIDAPIFSAKSIPSFIKIAAAIWLSIIMWIIVPVQALPDTGITIIMAVIVEIFIGFTLGFVSSIVLQAAQAAGDVLDMQMGLSVANVLSPTTGAMASITGSLLYLVALITFFLIDGHHMLISALHQSFVGLPLVTMIDFSNPNLVLNVLELLKFFWISAIQLCAPILLLIFLIDFAFGIVSRVAPQVNVFMLGFQVKPTMGVFGLMILSPLLIQHIIGLIGTTSSDLGKVILILAGR
jgi:flagellar biosynthetic protein FliR